MSTEVPGAQNTHGQQGSSRESHAARARSSCVFIFPCREDRGCQAVAAPFLSFWQRAVIFLLVNKQSQHSTVVGRTLRSKAYPKLGPQFYNPLTVNLTKTQAGFRQCRSSPKVSPPRFHCLTRTCLELTGSMRVGETSCFPWSMLTDTDQERASPQHE